MATPDPVIPGEQQRMPEPPLATQPVEEQIIVEETVATVPPTRRERVQSFFKRSLFGLTVATLLLMLGVVYFADRAIVTIHSGEEGVMWRRLTGTVVDTVFLEGTHIIFPWNIVYIYNVQIQTVDHSVTVLSTDGLEINVDVSTRYHPVRKTIAQLHQQIGPKYLEKVILPEVGTAVREVISQYRPNELYTRRTEEMQDQIRARASLQVQERFVELDDVLIRRIELPLSVQNAIQAKLTQEQEAQAYDFRLLRESKEADRKRTEALGIRDFQRTVLEGITPGLLRWKGIEATLELAKSTNAKVVVIGGREGLPLILNAESAATLLQPPAGSAAGSAAASPAASPAASAATAPRQ
jgi:regulator of protease activity HflC (stomatin/prohibitin superfamily)